MRGARVYLLAISSSLLLSLGLPNELFIYGFPLLGYLSLIPLYFALLEVPDWKRAACACGIYGALNHAFSSYWLFFFKDFAFWTLGISTLGYFVVYASLGLYLSQLVRKAGQARPLAFALMWTSFELLKSSGFLGYPWALLPYTQTSFLTILQVADRTGVYGLSFMLSLANASLGELLWGGQTSGAIEPRGWGAISLVRGSRGRRRIHVKIAFPESRRLATGAIVYHLGAAAAIFALVLGYGLWRLGTPIPERASLKVLIVQQNSNPWSDGTEAGLVVNMNLMRSALKKGEIRPDLVLFSESSLGRPYIDNRAYYETTPKGDPFLPYLRSTGLWLFTGSPVILDWKELSATNSVMLIDPRGRPVDTYAKMQLVPFGESIPFMEYSWFKTFMKAAVGLEGGWTMGTRYTLFRMPIPTGELRFGAPICFEDAFAPLCRQFVLEGADILVNLTDDSWSRTTSAEVQHLAAARFRSIETRRAQVRSTNSGVSGVIGPFGDIRQTLPLFVAAESIVEVPLVDPEPTAYLAYGEWFAIATLLLSFIWSLILAGRDILSQRRKV